MVVERLLPTTIVLPCLKQPFFSMRLLVSILDSFALLVAHIHNPQGQCTVSTGANRPLQGNNYGHDLLFASESLRLQRTFPIA